MIGLPILFFISNEFIAFILIHLKFFYFFKFLKIFNNELKVTKFWICFCTKIPYDTKEFIHKERKFIQKKIHMDLEKWIN